jgi:hypothetical protein
LTAYECSICVHASSHLRPKWSFFHMLFSAGEFQKCEEIIYFHILILRLNGFKISNLIKLGTQLY